MKGKIIQTVSIIDGIFARNGQVLFKAEKDMAHTDVFLAAYRKFGMNYPAFHKMDNLCKLAMLATDMLLDGSPHFGAEQHPRTGVILNNSSSSLDADLKHQEMIRDRNNYFPSPALFVYTLPSIMIGEICIRYKITGENICFISEEPDTEMLLFYLHDLFANNKVDDCIAGFVDYTASGYRANLFLAERGQGQEAKEELNHKNINKIFEITK